MREASKRTQSRRHFLGTSGALVATLTTTGADEKPRVIVPKVTLGRTGAEVSRLGIGCAYFQREQVSPDDVRATLQRALELGVNYLDVAPNYGNEETGFSEVKMVPALSDKAFRDQFFLVTKTEEPDRDGTWRLLEQSLKRMQTDRVDLVHLHNYGESSRWPDVKTTFGSQGAMAALREAREQGLIRFIGASGHLHPTRFHEAIDSGEIDVLMNAVNFVVQHTYDFENKVWARARSLDLGLVAMKVLGGAKQAEGGYRVPEDSYKAAVRYALSIPGVHVAVIGLENITELEKAAETVASAQPLSEDERLELARLGLDLAGTEGWKTAYGDPRT